jgi:two-component system response regulator MprA
VLQGFSVANAAHQPVPASIRLLLVDPNPRSARLIAQHLQAQGYAVTTVSSTDAVLSQLSAAAPQLALLADALPADQALSCCRVLRSASQVLPLLLLTPIDHFSARVAALEAGADDVLSQPYALEELYARIQALLRRSRMGIHHTDGAELRYRDLVVNTDSRQVWRAGVSIKLTVKEYDLLLHLLQNREQVHPRQQLLLDVWGESWVGDGNLLDVYIRYLRKKLERPDLDPLIHTVRGIGFMLK